MPHHAKHHASENRKAIERSLVTRTLYGVEPRRGSVMIKPKGRFFWFVRDALIHCCLYRNMPKAYSYVMIRQCVESRKDENETIARTGISDAFTCAFIYPLPHAIMQTIA